MRDKRLHNWIQRWADQGRQARRNAKRRQDTAPAASATTQADQPAVLAQPPASPAGPQAELRAIQPLPQQQTQASEQQRLRSSLSAVWSELQSRAGSADFVALLQQVFGPGRESTAQALADRLAAGDQLGLRFELLSGSVMGGAMGAYAAAGPYGQPMVYINADWLQGASDADLRLVLLEEISHGFDTVMNGGVDTAGDEGQLFAALVSGATPTADQLASITTDYDQTTLTIQGSQVEVEQAASGVTSSTSLTGATTLGTSYTTAQTISPTTATAISVTVAVNNTAGNGADILLAAYQGTSLIGWSVYDRSTNLRNTSVTLSFNLAQFNTSLTAGTNTTGLILRAWQGTYNGTSTTNVTSATASGSTASVAFSTNAASYSTNTTVSGTLTGGSQSRGWAVNASDLTAPAAPTLTLAADTGTSTTDRVTSNATINVSGLEAGASWEFSTDSGSTWSTGSVSSFSVADGSYSTGQVRVRQTDQAGNLGATNTSFAAFTVDTAAPTVTISDNVAGTAKIGDTVTFTFTFSEAVTGFNTTKLTVGNGTKGTFTAVSSTVYTLLVTPTASTSGNVTVDVSTTAVTDNAGNQAAAPAQYLQAFDTLAPAAPTLTLAADTGTSTTDRVTSNATINVSGLEAGASWEFSTDSGSTWSTGSVSSFSVADGSYSTGQVRVRQTDQAGNLGATNTSFAAFTVDTAAPTVTISDNVAGTAKIGDTVTFTFTFSEAVTGFNTTKLTVGNGTKGTFTAVSSTVYTLLVTPTASTSGNVTVDVSTTAVTDNAGNQAAAPAQYLQAFDTLAPAAPTLTLAADTGTSTTDRVTSNATINVSGLEAGASWQFSTDSGSTWSTGSVSSFSVADGSYSTGQVRVRQTDQAGNLGATNTSFAAFTVDTAAPTVTISDNVAGTAKIGDTVTFTFTFSEAVTGFNTTKLTVGNGTKGTFTAVSSTVYTLLVTPTASTSGNVTVDVSTTAVTDNAGNQAAAPAQYLQAFDTLAPAAPTLTLAADTGTSTTDRVTSNATINVSGLEAGASWQFSTDSGSTWSTGSVSSFSVADGSYSTGQVRVRQTDQAGNLGATNTSFAAFTVDTEAPNAASISSVLDNVGSVQGELTSGSRSNDDTLSVRVDLSGTNAAPGDRIQLHNDLAPLGTTYTLTAADISNGYADVPTGTLTDGITYQISAKLTDIAGNASPASAPFVITIDTSAPAAPTLALGTGVANGATAAEASQLSGVVTVNAETQSTVAVTFTRSGGGTVTRTLIGNGTAQALSLSVAEVDSLGDGLISVSATATDAAGNSSGTTSTSFTLDTSAPSALGLTPPADNGVNTNDGITTLNTFTISALETGSVWKFSTDAGTTWSAGSGTTFTAPDGSYGAGDIQVQQFDLAGNAGPISANSSAITINTNGAGPIITAISPGIAQTATPLNTGIVISFSEAIYANGGTLTVQDGNGNNNLYRMTLTSGQSSGSFSLGSGNWFIAGNKLYIDPVANFNGNTTFNIDISGSALVNASGIGNTTITSNNNSNYRFTTGATGTLDSQAPGTTVTSLALSTDSFGEGTTGTSSDFITRTAQQSISGTLSSTLAADELVQVSLDNGVTWRFADASAGNAFELSGGVLTGSNTLQARVIDGAGNAGTSRTQAYVLDTTAPGSAALALQADTGSSLRDGITSNANVLVSQLAIDTSWQVSTNGGGSWSTASGSSFSLAPGSYNASQVQVRQIDLAGNVSAVAGNSRTWVVDTTAPAFVSSGTAAAIAENSGANQLIYTPQMAATETLTGNLIFYSLAGGSDASLFSVDTFSGDVRLLVNPNYESQSSYSLILRATDLAGLSTDQTLTVAILDRDELAPLAPVFNAIAGDQRINAQEAADGVVISGSAEGGSTVTISWGNVSQTVTTSGSPSGTGTWSTKFSLLDLPADGLSTITATARDAAGNGSQASSTSVDLDQTTPGQPSLAPVAGNNRINAAEKTAGVTLSGSAEAGAAIAIAWNGTTRTTTADASTGAWSLAYSSAQIPADTTNSVITVTATDLAGNVSTPISRSVVIDTAAPNAPLINTVAGNDIVNAAEKAAGITLSGTGEIGSSASITWGSFAATTTVNSSGIWSVLVPTGSVPNDAPTSSVSVTLTDAAGNVSAPGTKSVRIDTGAPLAPVINAVAGDNLINAAEKAAGLTLSGSTDAENGSTVAITWGTITRTATVSGGTWSLGYTSAQIPADAASSTISAVVTDTAGNASAAGTRSVVIDTVAPALTIAALRFGDAVTGGGSTDTGVIKNDFITSSSTQTLNGTLSAALGATDTVWVRLNSGGATGSWIQASASGTTFSTSLNLGATDNSGSFDVQVRDAAGNPGATRNQTYRLDTAPAGVTISSFALSADTGISATDRITSSATQTFSGTLSTNIAAGESVWYSLNGGAWTQASTTTGRNTWSFTGTLSTANGGVNSIAVRHQDIAGNASAASPFTVTYDATPPTLSSLVLAPGGTDNLYGLGDVVTVTATFSESVLITGTPRVALNVGGVTRYATYSSGSNSNKLTFSYTVAAGDTDANGISLAANALQLNQGTIRDAAGTNALIGTAVIADQANAAVDSSVSISTGFRSSNTSISLGTNDTHALLTGSTAANLVGNDDNNILTGNQSDNSISGGLGRDILTGGGGTDQFRINNALESQLGSQSNSFDWIRDFEVGVDQIIGPWGAPIQQAVLLGGVSKLSNAAIGQLLNTTTFATNVPAAAFTFAGLDGTHTYLAVNNGISGFNAQDDVLVEITGYLGAPLSSTVI